MWKSIYSKTTRLINTGEKSRYSMLMKNDMKKQKENTHMTHKKQSSIWMKQYEKGLFK